MILCVQLAEPEDTATEIQLRPIFPDGVAVMHPSIRRAGTANVREVTVHGFPVV